MSSVKVFISYAREDASLAHKLYDRLTEAGVSPWLDSEALLPGQNWRVHIKHAIESSDYFIALLSSKSVDKRGYVQKELKHALDLLDEFPESEIFLVPVRLEECLPSHAKIKDLHWVDLFPSFEAGVSKILRVVLSSAAETSHEIGDARDSQKSLTQQKEPALAAASPSGVVSSIPSPTSNGSSPLSLESNAHLGSSPPPAKPALKSSVRIWISVGVIASLFVIGLIVLRTRSGSLSENLRPPNSAAEDNSTPIKVGVYLDLSGSLSALGQSTLKGIKMAADEINKAGGVDGRQIEILVEDDHGEPYQAATAVSKLINQEKVHAVLGEIGSALSLAAAPRAQAAKIPMIAPFATNPRVTEVGDYIFHACFSDPFQGSVMASFAKENLGAKTATVLVDRSSPYSESLGKAFEETFNHLGGEILKKESYAGRDASFTSQLLSIGSANSDVLFVPGYYSEVGLIAREAKRLGIKAPLLGGDGWDSPKLWEIGGNALDGSFIASAYSVNNPRETFQRFVSRYKLVHDGEIPDAFAAYGYDAMRILGDAIERAKTPEAKKLRDAIAQTRAFPGVTGNLTFDLQRNTIKSAVVLELQRGRFRYKATVHPGEAR